MNFNIAKSSSNNIYETFSPLYKALKIFGIIPFKMCLKDGKVTMSWFSVLWMLVFWVFWSYLIAGNLILGARTVNERSAIVLNGWHWLLVFEIAASFYIQLVNVAKRKSIGRLFRIFDEVDSMVSMRNDSGEKLLMNSFQNSTMYYRQNHTELKDLTWKIILGSQLIHLALIFFSQFSMRAIYSKEIPSDVFYFGGLSYVALVNILTHHQFIFAVSNIRLRFKLLNMNLTFVQLVFVCKTSENHSESYFQVVLRLTPNAPFVF